MIIVYLNGKCEAFKLPVDWLASPMLQKIPQILDAVGSSHHKCGSRDITIPKFHHKLSVFFKHYRYICFEIMNYLKKINIK